MGKIKKEKKRKRRLVSQSATWLKVECWVVVMPSRDPRVVQDFDSSFDKHAAASKNSFTRVDVLNNDAAYLASGCQILLVI